MVLFAPLAVAVAPLAIALAPLAIARLVLAHHPASAHALCLTARPFSCVMSDQSSPTDSAFLQQQLSVLLASPYIHFNPPQGILANRIRTGPGPVDLFSTRFNQFFTNDATGVIRGTTVDRDGLKEALLALQRKWNPETAKFENDLQPTTTRFVWTPSNEQSDEQAEVTASAEFEVDENGVRRISSLSLDGTQSLFPSSQAESS